MPSGWEGCKTRYNREEGEDVGSLFLQCFSIYTDLNGFISSSLGDAFIAGFL